MGKIIKNGISYGSAGSSGGSDIQVLTQEEYDALVTAGTVDENIYYFIGDEDENGEAGDNIPAFYIGYDNSTSGLTATDIQGAVDEVNSRVDINTTNISELNKRLEENFQGGVNTIVSAVNTKVGTSLTGANTPAEIAEVINSIESGVEVGRIDSGIQGTKTFNIKALYPDDYTKYTADDFFVVATGAQATSSSSNVGKTSYGASYTGVGVNTITKSYNNSTGVLTVTVPDVGISTPTTGIYPYSNDGYTYVRGYATVKIVYSVYLVQASSGNGGNSSSNEGSGSGAEASSIKQVNLPYTAPSDGIIIVQVLSGRLALGEYANVVSVSTSITVDNVVVKSASANNSASDKTSLSTSSYVYKQTECSYTGAVLKGQTISVSATSSNTTGSYYYQYTDSNAWFIPV